MSSVQKEEHDVDTFVYNQALTLYIAYTLVDHDSFFYSSNVFAHQKKGFYNQD